MCLSSDSSPCSRVLNPLCHSENSSTYFIISIFSTHFGIILSVRAYTEFCQMIISCLCFPCFFYFFHYLSLFLLSPSISILEGRKVLSLTKFGVTFACTLPKRLGERKANLSLLWNCWNWEKPLGSKGNHFIVVVFLLLLFTCCPSFYEAHLHVRMTLPFVLSTLNANYGGYSAIPSSESKLCFQGSIDYCFWLFFFFYKTHIYWKEVPSSNASL